MRRSAEGAVCALALLDEAALTTDPWLKGGQIRKTVFGTYLVRIEAGLLLTYAKVTGGGLRFWWCRRGAIPT